MSELFNIQKLKEVSQPIIKIPGFDNDENILVRVQKPNLMSLLSRGKIPNHLLSTVNRMITGTSSKKEKEDESSKGKEVAKLYELYSEICLVEPTYAELKEYITDQQQEAIFDWATSGVKSLDSFRDVEDNGADNNDGQELPEKTE